MENTRYFREKIAGIGLEVLPGEHPIVPVMFGEAQPAVKMAEALAGERRLCYSVLISGCAEREGEDQNAGFGGPFKRGSGFCDREICRGERRTRNCEGDHGLAR